MKPTVHILATVRNPALLDAALLVFRTLRTGFPTARVQVWGNGLSAAHCHVLEIASAGRGCEFHNLPDTFHDAWIAGLIATQNEPFWICDTDIVFFESVEAWPDSTFRNPQSALPFAGRYEPEFDEPWTQTLHVARLHTCLMWIDPAQTRVAQREVFNRIPEPWRGTANFPLVEMSFIPTLAPAPSQRGMLCYDTMAGLYQAGYGRSFTALQNAAFEHLHCATYADLAGPHLGNGRMQEMHRRVYADPQSARGLYAQQLAYYASRPPHVTPKENPCPT